MTKHGLLGWIAVVVVVSATSARTYAGFATFDDLKEGFYEGQLIDGGIRFFDGDARILPFPTLGSTLVVEDASLSVPGIDALAPFFSSPNVLGLTLLVPGPHGSIGTRFGSLRMTTGSSATSGSLDVFFTGDAERANNRIDLEAYLGDRLVAADSVSVLSTEYQHAKLQVSGVLFDTLRVAGTGPDELGAFFGRIDNVRIVPEPSTLVLFGYVVAVGIVRRVVQCSSSTGRTK